MLRITLPALSNTVRLAVQGHLDRLRHRGARAHLRRRSGSSTNTFRIVEVYLVVAPMYLVTGYAILLLLRLLERRFAIGR